MKKILKFSIESISWVINMTFSLSGPFIISLGTFSGLIFLLDIFSSKPSSESYLQIYIGYLFFLYSLAWFTEIRTKNLNETKNIGLNSTVIPSENEVVQNIKNQQYLRIFFSGGISKIINYILEKNNVVLYELFKRPIYWNSFPENQKEYPIFRLLKNNTSLEIRFPKNEPNKILIRETLPNSNNYGDFKEESLWNWKFLFILTPMRFILQILG